MHFRFKILVFLGLALLCDTYTLQAQELIPEQPQRQVENNVLVSHTLPVANFEVEKDFSYLGKFDFRIRDVGYGERHVFVDVCEGKVQRMLIFQFEGFLPSNTQTFNYDFSQADVVEGFLLRQNTYAYSNENAIKNNPQSEAALTVAFIRSQEYELEDQLMMSRFVMVPDVERRNELIIFYVENAAKTGYDVSTFWNEDDTPTAHWQKISKGLTHRSKGAFSILKR
jgi:hypothetical protein